MEESSPILSAISVVAVTIVAIISMKVVRWLWLRPKMYEKFLKDQGYHANPYRILRGDMLDFAAMAQENRPKQIKLADNVSFHASPYIHSIIKKYGIVSTQTSCVHGKLFRCLAFLYDRG